MYAIRSYYGGFGLFFAQKLEYTAFCSVFFIDDWLNGFLGNVFNNLAHRLYSSKNFFQETKAVQSLQAIQPANSINTFVIIKPIKEDDVITFFPGCFGRIVQVWNNAAPQSIQGCGGNAVQVFA